MSKFSKSIEQIFTETFYQMENFQKLLDNLDNEIDDLKSMSKDAQNLNDKISNEISKWF